MYHFKLFSTVCSLFLLATAQISGQETKSIPPGGTVADTNKAIKAAPAPAPVQQVSQNDKKSPLIVDRVAICLDIKDNEPDMIDSVFPPEAKRLYCFTHIKGATNGSEIQHRWYFNDELQSSVSLKIGSASWRTHSIKSIPSVYTGEWMVAIVDSKNEEVLKTLKFYVK
jgi:hypothetical protein